MCHTWVTLGSRFHSVTARQSRSRSRDLGCFPGLSWCSAPRKTLGLVNADFNASLAHTRPWGRLLVGRALYTGANVSDTFHARAGGLLAQLADTEEPASLFGCAELLGPLTGAPRTAFLDRVWGIGAPCRA